MRMIKGKWVGTVTIDFLVDEKTDGLLPFNEVKDGVENGGIDSDLQKLIQDEIGELGTVVVKKQFANLHLSDEA